MPMSVTEQRKYKKHHTVRMMLYNNKTCRKLLGYLRSVFYDHESVRGSDNILLN